MSYEIVIPTSGRRSLHALLAVIGLRDVIVVDDRRDRAQPLPAPPGVRVVAGPARGPAAARNVGWRAARAEWVAFLDDDVLPPPDWREALERDLRAAGDAGATQGRIIVPVPERPTDWARNVAGLEAAQWATADMAYRREALAAVGGFDERFPRAYREDADLGLRVVGAGWRIVRGQRHIVHPVGSAPPSISLRKQAGNADDVLMRRLHGADWRERAGVPSGRRPRHLAVATAGVGALAAATVAAVARRRESSRAASSPARRLAAAVTRRHEPSPARRLAVATRRVAPRRLSASPVRRLAVAARVGTPRRPAASPVRRLAVAARVIEPRRLAASPTRPARLVAIGLGGAWLAGTAELAWARIKPGPRTAREVATMAWTSAAMPFFASAWWLRGFLGAPGEAPRPRPKAVLFDRDGTLIADVPYNGDPERVEPMPGAREALDRLRAAHVPVAIVSNQSGIARGLLSPQDVLAVHGRMEALLGPLGPLEYCPHGPDDGCACRKPAPGLIQRAAAALGVDPSECAVIGDIGADVGAALAAGARPILVPTPITRAEEVAAAPETARDLAAALDLLGFAPVPVRRPVAVGA